MPQNAKQLRTRIKSVDSTMHITKAMELVASSKLRRATDNMEASRPYFSALDEAISHLSRVESVFTKKTDGARPCYIVMAGDRGLAGGYNNNIYKLLKAETDGRNAVVIAVGKRAADHAKKHGYNVILSIDSIENATVADTYEIGKKVNELFTSGETDEVNIIYTRYISMLAQEPSVKKLLPITASDESKPKGEMLIEPSAGEVLKAVIPEYISGMTYGAVCESFASELSARRNAMDSASKNAEEMIETLELRYNRARQSAITQEITEIIGGSSS